MITKKERGAQTAAETRLLSEEGRRRDTHRGEVRRLLEQAALASAVYFRGNDRSPDENDVSVAKAAETVMAQALPDVFDRFADGAARVTKADITAILESDDLRGLPSVFSSLKLLRNEKGTLVIETDSGPLGEMLTWIGNKCDYGSNPQGKALETEFGNSPYGWDIDVIKLLTLCLLRAGKITATSQGLSIESVEDVGASDVFTNNTKYRAATFRFKKVLGFEEIVEAANAFKHTFGEEIKSLNQDEVAKAIRDKSIVRQRDLRDVLAMLERHRLPGAELFSSAISQMDQISTAGEEDSILSFVGGHAELKDALARAASIQADVAEPQLRTLDRAQYVLQHHWPFLAREASTTYECQQDAARLGDLMQKETFYKELPSIDQHSSRLEQLYDAAFQAAVEARSECYAAALDQLKSTAGWEQLQEEVQQRISAPLADCTSGDVPRTTPIPQLRADVDACDKRLADAVAEIHRLIEGDRIVQVKVGSYFTGGIDTEEQLDAALGSEPPSRFGEFLKRNSRSSWKVRSTFCRTARSCRSPVSTSMPGNV